MTHKNNRFLNVDDLDLGEEAKDALKSELVIVEPKRLERISNFIN